MSFECDFKFVDNTQLIFYYNQEQRYWYCQYRYLLPPEFQFQFLFQIVEIFFCILSKTGKNSRLGRTFQVFFEKGNLDFPIYQIFVGKNKLSSYTTLSVFQLDDYIILGFLPELVPVNFRPVNTHIRVAFGPCLPKTTFYGESRDREITIGENNLGTPKIISLFIADNRIIKNPFADFVQLIFFEQEYN